jgi:WD40 repeat protein
MSQRLDSENELVTSTTDGLLLFWDCDEVDPVQAIDVGSHQKLSCVRISPSGRYSARRRRVLPCLPSWVF